MDVKRHVGKESGGRKGIDRQSEKRRGTDGEQGRGQHRREGMEGTKRTGREGTQKMVQSKAKGAESGRWGEKTKETGSRIEGGGRGGRTEDRQMEGTRRDRWEGGEADGERSHGWKRAGWGQREKVMAQEWERQVETPGKARGEGTGPKGSRQKGGTE